MQTANGQKVYDVAAASLGKKLSGSIPELGCAITVNNIVEKALGLPIGGGYSTRVMYSCLQGQPARFLPVSEADALPGDVVISPTGFGNGDLPNGHVGILAKHGIVSNDSASGEVHQYWSLEKWKKFYGGYGGYPVLFYRFI